MLLFNPRVPHLETYSCRMNNVCSDCIFSSVLDSQCFWYIIASTENKSSREQRSPTWLNLKKSVGHEPLKGKIVTPYRRIIQCGTVFVLVPLLCILWFVLIRQDNRLHALKLSHLSQLWTKFLGFCTGLKKTSTATILLLVILICGQPIVCHSPSKSTVPISCTFCIQSSRQWWAFWGN